MMPFRKQPYNSGKKLKTQAVLFQVLAAIVQHRKVPIELQPNDSLIQGLPLDYVV